MADRFDKFTEHARHVLTMAQVEGNRLRHDYTGSEHILLALVQESDSGACQIPDALGVQPAQIRREIGFIIANDIAPRGGIGLTPRAAKVIKLSVEEARRRDRRYVGTEHLLAGLLLEKEGVAFGVLESLGVSIDGVRRETIRRESYIPAPKPAGEKTPIAWRRRVAPVGSAADRDSRDYGVIPTYYVESSWAGWFGEVMQVTSRFRPL